MRLSMVMIARDEEHNVAPCFETFWDAVDEVVLCDTGSVDETLTEARRFAAERGNPAKLVTGVVPWCDDFGAARTYAHSLASGDVHSYVDLDDRIEGAEHLREVAAQIAPADAPFGAIAANYVLSDCETSPYIRFFRAPGGWIFPTWEEPECATWKLGPTKVPVATTDLVAWRHTTDGSHGRRDLDIALKWSREEPESWLAWTIAAIEGRRAELDWKAITEWVERALAAANTSPYPPSDYFRGVLLDTGAVAWQHLGKLDLAEEMGRVSVACWPQRAAATVVACCAFERGAFRDAVRFATLANELPGPPMDDLVHDFIRAAHSVSGRLTV